MALDGKDLAGDAAQRRRRVARTGSHLEHLVGGLEFEQLDHARDNVRLRDGLPGLDGERRILIGEVCEMLCHEGLARHCAHGRKHQRIADPAPGEMPSHHNRPVARVGVGLFGEVGSTGGHGD